MSFTAAALKKMNKDEVIALTLEYLAKFNSTLANIADLKSHLRRMESELPIFISVNSKLFDRVISFELQYCTNNQYTRRDCLEITGLPEIPENGNLEDLKLKVLNKIGLNIDSKNVTELKLRIHKKLIISPIRIYRLKFNNRNIRTRCEICSKLCVLLLTLYIVYVLRC